MKNDIILAETWTGYLTIATIIVMQLSTRLANQAS